MNDSARVGLLLVALCIVSPHKLCAQEVTSPDDAGIFSRDNLVAWCIVPFDGKKRGPAARADMIKRLGLRRVAYDWRQEHVATFEQEILEYKKRGIEYFAFWDTHPEAFRLFEKYELHPQIWKTLSSPAIDGQEMKVRAAVESLLPLVARTRDMQCKLGLYNHGAWGGEPENLVAVCRFLRQHHDADHVGIVYNQHHAHGRVGDFGEVLELIQPYLLCLNLNGMARDGDRRGQKILPLGEGEFDVGLLKVIRESGYEGPVGIIGHTQDDVEQRLRDNLDGLDWILPQLDGRPPGPKPALRTSSPAAPDSDSQGSSGKHRHSVADRQPAPNHLAKVPLHSVAAITEFIRAARNNGNAHRGLVVFGSAKSACLSCHKIGHHGGGVGPALNELAKQRKPAEIIESVVWPQRHVPPEYAAKNVVTLDGRSYRGYVIHRDPQQLVLRDPTMPDAEKIAIEVSDIDVEQDIGTLMPDNLIASMSERQLYDLFQFLLGLGLDEGIPTEEMQALLAHSHSHRPAEFAPDRKPLQPEYWPSWQHFVNRDRVYDFYAKQADHFRRQAIIPPLLAEYPGLDGGTLGHWGNQDDDYWASDRWNDTTLGAVHCGVFRGDNATVPRGVCVQLGDRGEMAACFNPDTLSYDAVWTGGFLKFSSFRHGFLNGALMDGVAVGQHDASWRSMIGPGDSFRYLGYYRRGGRVVFSYMIRDVKYLDSPWVKDGEFQRVVAPADQHPLRAFVNDPPTASPREFETSIELGANSPYAIDAIHLPSDNPWKAQIFVGGLAFLPDGSAMICTMHGDVWHVSGFEYPSQIARWRRFASGLNHALGIVIGKDGIFVQGRDQITRLHDLNHDGKADYYECFSRCYATSPAGHDFICGLERDADGHFYTASGNQGLVRISPDGRSADVLATGFRNPDGLALLPDGTVTVPAAEGSWTPASMLCAVRPSAEPSFHGAGGPRDGLAPELPLVYLPRGVDNSCGGQTLVQSRKWGPLEGQLIHFSFGTGTHHLILRDEVGGQMQGAVVPLPGEFRSGVHRGRYSPSDGQLYVGGMQGWGTYTTHDGCFERVRYTGAPVQLPVGFRVHENGIAVRFSGPIDREIVREPRHHFAQCWNYRYSSAYGSPEFSTRHFGVRGHDALAIATVHALGDNRTLFFEIPEIQPVSQLHLRIRSNDRLDHDLFITVHKLDSAFTRLPGYRPLAKTIQPHPIVADLAMATRRVPNPFQKAIKDARRVRIETGTNLSYETRSFRVRAGQAIQLTLANPDVVPHNWVLVKPGTLQRVGQLANQFISDPDAAIHQYVPSTDDVIAYTDVVLPREKFAIQFLAPEQPGRYPYLCTFPGHWLVMNGEMIVDE